MSNEVMDLFPEWFEGYVVAVETREIDDDLGLPIVEKETVYSKYGVYLQPDKNDFHKSLQTQFDRKGFLSEKQLRCIKA